MNDPDSSTHPVAEAIKWATRASSIALEMVLPGLAGQWADEKFGLSFLTLTGFAFGLSIALYHLILMAREVEQTRQAKLQSRSPTPTPRSSASAASSDDSTTPAAPHSASRDPGEPTSPPPDPNPPSTDRARPDREQL